jgi:hypothetical protein
VVKTPSHCGQNTLTLWSKHPHPVVKTHSHCGQNTLTLWSKHSHTVVKTPSHCGQNTLTLWSKHPHTVVKTFSHCGQNTLTLWSKHLHIVVKTPSHGGQNTLTLCSKFRDDHFECQKFPPSSCRRASVALEQIFLSVSSIYPYKSISIMGSYLSITTLQYDNRYASIRYKVYRFDFSFSISCHANHFL